MREATVEDLKVGDTFDWEGGSWHGPSVLTEKYVSRPASRFTTNRGRTYGKPVMYRLTYDNSKVVSPPGLDYSYADKKVEIHDA